MTTAKQLIAYLQTLPEDTICECVTVVSWQRDCYGRTVNIELPDQYGYSETVEIFDFTTEGHKDSIHYGKTFVKFGAT